MIELSNVGHRSWPITWLDMSPPGDSSHWSIDLLPWPLGLIYRNDDCHLPVPTKGNIPTLQDLETSDPWGEEKPQNPDWFEAALLLGHSKSFWNTAGGISPVHPLAFSHLWGSVLAPENQCPQHQNRWCSNLLADLSILLFQNGDRAGKESEIWTTAK